MNGTHQSVRKALVGNLASGFKLALFIRVQEERIAVNWWQIPVFSLLSAIASFLWTFVHVGLDGQFQGVSLASALFYLPLLLLAGIFAAYAVGRSEKSLLLMQVFLMISVVIDLLLLAFWMLLDIVPVRLWRYGLTTLLFYLPAVWVATASAIAIMRLASSAVQRWILAFCICAFLIAYPLSMAYRERALWGAHYDAEIIQTAPTPHKTIGSRHAFHEQPRILQRELAALQPGRKGIIDVYFVGVAGHADQDVFMKEVNAAARLFQERFGSEGRAVRLVNNMRSIADSPIASTASLRASLKRVSEVMNKDEDILFLFLTSHGSEAHDFSLELWPLRFNKLDPARLRGLLDESGIKYRVVAVSSCYSGGFIDWLKDNNTLVMSASAYDKNSFGCSSDAEWTYFGRAYFDEALRKTFSFTDAFDLAKTTIAEWEAKKDFDPSEPQIAEGAAIRIKLVALEQQLRVQKRVKVLLKDSP